MRTKITLLLLFLNVVLFFFIFKFERNWRTERASLEARRRVLGPEATDIRTLTITHDKDSLSLEKRAEGWFITQPLDWPANPNAVSRMLNELQFLEHDASFKVADLGKNKQTLADYGLDQPVLTVAFTSGDPAGKTPTLLRIGHATKVDNRLYILSPDGERVHVVGRGLSESLTLSIEQLRAESLFDIPVFEVRSFSLQTAAPANLRIRLRRDNNRWSFETPIIARASKTNTELTINALNSLRLRTFVDKYPLENTPAAAPTLRLSLEGNSRTETLLVGERVGPESSVGGRAGADYYAMLDRRPTLFTVTIPNALMATLRNAQETLRETRLLDFDLRTVTGVTLSEPNKAEITLQRLDATTETSGWQVIRREAGQSPQTQAADGKVVQRLLEQLSLLSAKKFLSDAPQAADLENWGFNRPQRQITLNLGVAGTAPLIVQIGVPSERTSEAYARLTNAPFVYAIDPAILTEVPVEARAYRERVINDLPAGARITGLTFEDTEAKTVLYHKELGSDETWSQALSTEAAARRSALESLLNQLSTLRARNFVRDDFPERVELAGEERPWKYSLKVSLALVGGNGAQTPDAFTLFFTDRVGGDLQLAGSARFNGVFELEQPFLDALWALTYGPRDPGSDMENAPIRTPASSK